MSADIRSQVLSTCEKLPSPYSGELDDPVTNRFCVALMRARDIASCLNGSCPSYQSQLRTSQYRRVRPLPSKLIDIFESALRVPRTRQDRPSLGHKTRAVCTRTGLFLVRPEAARTQFCTLDSLPAESAQSPD